MSASARRHKQALMDNAHLSGPGIPRQWAGSRKDATKRAERYRAADKNRNKPKAKKKSK